MQEQEVKTLSVRVHYFCFAVEQIHTPPTTEHRKQEFDLLIFIYDGIAMRKRYVFRVYLVCP